MNSTHVKVFAASVIMLLVCFATLRRPVPLPPVAPPKPVVPAVAAPVSPAYQEPQTELNPPPPINRLVPPVLQAETPQQTIYNPPPAVVQQEFVPQQETSQNTEPQGPQPLYYTSDGIPVYMVNPRTLPPEQRTYEQQSAIDRSDAALRDREAREYQRRQMERRFFDNVENAARHYQANQAMRRRMLGGGGGY